MDELIALWEKPTDQENYMIAGWRQWADAGEISSGLPRYLIEQTGAHKIGEIKSDGFYLFQIPGTHHLIRPHVKLEDGHRQSMSTHENALYYADLQGRGLLIFLGDEPHQNEARYAGAFLDIVQALGVKRVIALGGVYGAMPYAKDREVSCVYSLPAMKEELSRYALTFSNYEGGTTIGTYLADRAESRDIELAVLYAFAPAYEFSRLGITIEAMRIEEDWKAWYDIMRRVDFMFHLGLDLSDLKERSKDLLEAWDARVEELAREHPDLRIKAYLDAVAKDFVERPFIPLDEAWDELGDLLDDMDE